MKKQKKIIVLILLFLIILLSNCQVFATDYLTNIKRVEYTEEFLEYLKLTDEEKSKTIMPRPYNIPKNSTPTKNPLKLATVLRNSNTSKYSLRDIIPENMVIKNQQQTNSCWTFSSIATLESTLALNDYKNGKTPIVYDFSERHMEYATTESFLDGAINKNGFNRELDDGGNYQLSIPYLTNGLGAISETEMPFENKNEKTYITDIQNKRVLTQVNDIVIFPSYKTSDDKTAIIQEMKNHLKNYGAIDVAMHGSQHGMECYNEESGAIYCDHDIPYGEGHAVAIIGWDDDYSKDNFAEGKKPTKNGAWIIKNSWGTGESYTLEEMKKYIFETFTEEMAQAGYTDSTQIPDELAIYNFETWGFTVENNVATLKMGDNGFMYVSYEDHNIYLQMTGIQNAQAEVEYENLYQYDEFGSLPALSYQDVSKAYIAQVFEKKTSGKEYLTQVSINAPETYTCKVFVNPNGTSKAKNDLQKVQLVAGENETFDAGYHTIEFLEPVEIIGQNFVVVVEIEANESNSVIISQEINTGEYGYSDIWDNAVAENGKCFVSYDENLAEENWCDTSTLYALTNGNVYNGDTTIKAFTTSNVLESIKVKTPPAKTSYIKGQNFDETGMVVMAQYTNGEAKTITDYSIQNGTNLQLTQTSITISYKGKTVTQPITVKENIVESLKIIIPPTKIEYFAGEDFDKNGMTIEATYTDGTTKTVTDFTIKDGTDLKSEQKSVTISYQGKTVTQPITVKVNPVVKIEIIANAKKLNYVVGQNFNSEGMRVKATYENGLEKEITDYTITNGTNLQEGQTAVTIEYEGQTATQAISVVAKTVTEIKVKTMPTKTEYIQNKEELDLAGGVIEILYNDNTKEEIKMTSNEITATGFDNKEVGTKTITLTYKEKTIQFNINIKEEPKPENSNFDNMKGNLTRIRTYYFTDKTKDEYIVFNVEASDIIKATVNDNMEYYYYLSSNKQKANITDWVKINSIENTGDKLSFEVNTLDISNYEEVANAENVYLYIKEVATRNGMKSEVTTSPILLEVGELKIEEYVDGNKKVEVDPDQGIDSTPGEGSDNTKALGTIPNAGKNIIIICLICVAFGIGSVSYKKYKDIQIK